MNNQAGLLDVDQALRLRDLMMRMSVDALAFTPPNRADGLAKQFLSKCDLNPDDTGALIGLTLQATSLAADLAIFAPSATGSTAVERYLRKRRPGTGDEAIAAASLARARFRVIRVDAADARGILRATDLASGERITLVLPGDEPLTGFALATRVCPLDRGCFVATGPAIPLNDAGLDVARGFFRPNGKGLTNAERCAEALYRHTVRHKIVPIDLAALLGDIEADEPDPFPYGPESGPGDALAHRWAGLAHGEAPTADDVAAARSLACPNHAVSAIVCAGIADDYRLPRLSEAYARLAVIQLETMQRRALAGSGDLSAPFEVVAKLIDDSIRAGKMRPSARPLFADLKRQAQAAIGNAKAGDGDLDRLRQVIQGLRAKTVDQGCTEAEAVAAAAKVAELLDRYGLSLSDVELRRQTCEGAGIETGRRRVGPIDQIVPHIASFFDCRCWRETTEEETLRHVFFGLPADVAAAQYLYDLIEITFETETWSFKTGDFYGNLYGGERRSGTNSFQLGLAHGIVEKLDVIRRQREAALNGSSGRDLIVVKASVVEEELEKLGLSFVSKGKSAKKYILPDAYEAGQEAGKRFEYVAGIGR